MFKRSAVVMEQAGGGEGGAGGGSAAGAGGAAGGAELGSGGADQSLLQKPPSGGGGAGGGGADDLAWLPEKFRTNGADGKLDMAASTKKMGESYLHLEKQRGPQPPAAASDYKFTPGEKHKDVKLDDQLSAQFREGAHKAGFSQEQYQWVMEQYLEMVPQVLDATLKLEKQEAIAELQKVWKSTAEFETGVADAQRAVNNAPEAIREDLWARFGRDPAFIQFAASLGKEMREDRSPNTNSAGNGAGTDAEVQALMASEAYRNPRHAEHQAVSAKVSAYFQRVHGAAPAM